MLVTALLYSKNYCTPNITDGAAKPLGWVFVDKNVLGAMAGVGRDSSGWKFQGQCRVRKIRRDKARDELVWDIICVIVTLIAASEDQSPLSAEVCQGIPALQEGWGEQQGVGGCWDALSPHSCFKSWP